MPEAADPLQSALTTLLGDDLPLAGSELAAELDRRRLEAMSRLLQYRIATASKPTADRCRDALTRLTEADAYRLLRDPALCTILRLGEDENALAAALDAACGEAGRPHPALSCGLRIDRSLPVMSDHPSAGLRSPRRLSTDETRAATAQCERAMALLHDLDATGWSILSALAESLVLRIDDERVGECWGATSGLAIGRIVLVNSGDAVSDAHLAEALLHEAVHVALDCAELQRPLLLFDVAVDGPMLASPWTGTLLTGHAYLHAIVVWAVLLSFWDRLLADDGAEREDRVARRDWIRAGFDRFDPGSLELMQQSLAPRAGDVVRSVLQVERT